MEFNSLQLTRNGLVIKHAYKVAKAHWKSWKKRWWCTSFDRRKNPFPFCYTSREWERDRKLPTYIFRSNPHENVLSLWKNTWKFNNLKMFFFCYPRNDHIDARVECRKWWQTVFPNGIYTATLKWTTVSLCIGCECHRDLIFCFVISFYPSQTFYCCSWTVHATTFFFFLEHSTKTSQMKLQLK